MLVETGHRLLHEFENRDAEEQSLDDIESEEHDRMGYGGDASRETVDGGVYHLKDAECEGRVRLNKRGDFSQRDIRLFHDAGELPQGVGHRRETAYVFNSVAQD